MWLGVRSIDAGSEVPPPVWQPPQTLNALDLSCVRVGAAGGGVDEALICPRIAPFGSAGVFTFTYSLLALKLPTSLAAMVASSLDQWPIRSEERRVGKELRALIVEDDGNIG